MAETSSWLMTNALAPGVRSLINFVAWPFAVVRSCGRKSDSWSRDNGRDDARDGERNGSGDSSNHALAYWKAKAAPQHAGTHACQNPVAESHGRLHSQRSRSRRLSIQRKTDSRLIMFVCFLIPFYHLQCHLQTNCTVLLEFRCFRRRKEKKADSQSPLLLVAHVEEFSSCELTDLHSLIAVFFCIAVDYRRGKKGGQLKKVWETEREKPRRASQVSLVRLSLEDLLLRRRPGYCACGNFARSRWLLFKCCRKTTRRDHCAATSIICWKWTKVLAGT